jgi:hypothetical protein
MGDNDMEGKIIFKVNYPDINELITKFKLQHTNIEDHDVYHSEECVVCLMKSTVGIVETAQTIVDQLFPGQSR